MYISHATEATAYYRAAMDVTGAVGSPSVVMGAVPSIGKPEENHRKMAISWDFIGFTLW